MAKVRVKVKKDLCISCASCLTIAPEVFKSGEMGKSEVVPGFEEIEDEKVIEQVKNASQACPTQAIEVTET